MGVLIVFNGLILVILKTNVLTGTVDKTVSYIINDFNAVALILRMELKCYVETLDCLQL